MKKYLQLCVFAAFVLVAGSRYVLGDAPPSFGLTLSDHLIALAPNSPIWIDLTVTNSTTATFNGQYSEITAYGSVATTSPVTESLLQKCSDRTVADAMSQGFVIGAGKTKVFHIMLNDLVSDIKPGIVSGWIVLPLFDEATQPDVRFTLTAPFSVKVGPSLTPEQLSAVSDTILSDIESRDQELRSNALQTLNLLPDHYAVQILASAIKKLAPNAGYFVYVLGSRPRTPESTKALTDIAQSGDPRLSAQAKGYLIKASDNTTP